MLALHYQPHSTSTQVLYLLYNKIELDLFYLALWVSSTGVEIEHFNTSRLGVPYHRATGLFGNKLLYGPV